MQYDRICAIVKTFMRDDCLFHCVDSILAQYPGIKLVVVDDGKNYFPESGPPHAKVELYRKLQREGHVVIVLPFDAGYGAKANIALPYCDREFVLNVNDDFLFDRNSGLEKLQAVLDYDHEVGIASGRIDGIKYEGFLSMGDGWIQERLLPEDQQFEKVPDGPEYAYCDLTSVFSLIRRETLKWVKWDQEYKIGGEHLDFFLDILATGARVAFVKDVNVHTTHTSNHEYSAMRGRHDWKTRFAKKHKIREYRGFYGTEKF